MTPRSPEQYEQIRQQTRKQIKDSAFTLFARHGYSDTTVSAIAKEAGISKGLIYHYFNSKDEILVAIFEDLAELIERALDFPENMSADGCLRYLLETLFGYIEEKAEILRLMISLALQPEAADRLKPHIEKTNASQIAAMAELFKILDYEDPDNEAYYLAAKLDGIALGYITMSEEYPYETIKQKILEEYDLHLENRDFQR